MKLLTARVCLSTAAAGLLVAIVSCNKPEQTSPDDPGKEPASSAPSTPAAPAVGTPEAANVAQGGTETVKADPEWAAGALSDPAKANLTAPDVYKVKFETSKGDFIVEVHRDWAPRGADRFYNLVQCGFYDDVRFFRVLGSFVAQFGINGDPAVSSRWTQATIEDDPVAQSNTRGSITFATAGTNSRTTQVFINYGDNVNLDGMGFSPFGVVTGEGMKVVEALYGGYGEGPPRGRGPHQGYIQMRGNEYLKEQFPDLDYVKRATIVK